MDEPPTPIAMPNAAIKKDTGSTTFMAAIAVEPIQFPTKIVSTRILRDITKIPIDAGTACFMRSLPMGCVPRSLKPEFDLIFVFSLNEFLINSQLSF